jgi:Protein of unknown function (DUF3421)
LFQLIIVPINNCSSKVLTGTGMLWSKNVEQGRVVGGTTVDGGPLYICRVKTDRRKTPGKLHNDYCYVPIGDLEFKNKIYETLYIP